MKDLRIVIPAYNEQEGIGDVLNKVKVSCPNADIVVVNDNSQDRTANIALQHNVKVINNLVNMGYGGALKVGFQQQDTPDQPIRYFAFLDADTTYSADDIPKLYSLCIKGNFDLVVGSRLTTKSIGMPRIRKIGNKIFALLASFYTNTKITDVGSGLRVFKLTLLPLIDHLPNGLYFTPAMTMHTLFTGFQYTEIPIKYGKRVGKSKLSSIKDGFRFLAVVMNATRKYRPFLFFCTLGIPYILVEAVVNRISTKRT